MLTQTTYIEYLLSTPKHHTCTHLAAHLPEVRYDQVNRFLRTSKLPINSLRELAEPLLHDSPEAFLLVDDSVQDKRYSHFIDLTKRQYSGNAHGMATGIGLVNLVHGSGERAIFCPWITASTRPTTTSRRKTTIFWPCLTKSWRKASCWPAPFYLILGTRAVRI